MVGDNGHISTFGMTKTTKCAKPTLRCCKTVCPEFQWTFSFWPFAKLQISLPFLHSLVRLSSSSVYRKNAVSAAVLRFSPGEKEPHDHHSNIFAQVFANQSCLANWWNSRCKL